MVLPVHAEARLTCHWRLSGHPDSPTPLTSKNARFQPSSKIPEIKASESPYTSPGFSQHNHHWSFFQFLENSILSPASIANLLRGQKCKHPSHIWRHRAFEIPALGAMAFSFQEMPRRFFLRRKFITESRYINNSLLFLISGVFASLTKQS